MFDRLRSQAAGDAVADTEQQHGPLGPRHGKCIRGHRRSGRTGAYRTLETELDIGRDTEAEQGTDNEQTAAKPDATRRWHECATGCVCFEYCPNIPHSRIFNLVELLDSMTIFIGCAGWSLRKEFAAEFPGAGSHLERYAGRFNGVEINSSFYRPHRQSTYQRWAASTPPGFGFAVKLPKSITHTQRLVDVQPLVEQFASEISGLGEKLSVVLVQLPPSLNFREAIAESFFRKLQAAIPCPVACEPRHRSWFEPTAEQLLLESGVSRVAADPSVVPAAAEPGGERRRCYVRWHGSPQMYYSSYDDPTLHALAARLRELAKRADPVWCIFDNTAEGAATSNALQLLEWLADDLRNAQ